MKFNLIVRSLALAGLFISVSSAYAAEAPKDATAATQQANNALFNQLPFSDNTDFTDAHKGLLRLFLRTLSKGNKEMLSGIHSNIRLLKKAIKHQTPLIPAYGVNLS